MRVRWEWLAAFILASGVHLGLAAMLIGPEGAMIERGPGDGGPLVIGSLADAMSEALEAEEADSPDEAPMDAETPPEPPVATQPPLAPEVPTKLAELTEREAPDEARMPEPDAVLPPLPEDLAPEVKSETEEVEPAPLVPEVKDIIPPAIEAEPPKPATVKPQPKKRKAAKPKPKRRSVDSRRGGSGGAGRGGGGGRGLGGRAIRSNYQGRVIAHLRRYKSYPREARRRRLTGTVRVRFTISSSGRVINSALVSRSGSAVLDAGARQTIRRANPFPPFPGGMGKSRMTFVVPIRYSVR